MDLAQATLAQVSVNARDLRRAVAFYRDTLGVPHLFDAGPALSFFLCGGVRLMVSTAEKGEFDHASSILYFQVADIDTAHRDLSAKGVKFRDQPHFVAPLGKKELWMSFFDDTEGNVMAITAEK
jgi:methylmalonyl-CoA/ethylmalonyl-CoA epimerase